MEGKRVDSKLMLFTLVLVLITLLLLNYFFNNNRTDSIWNYKEITSAIDVIYLGEKVTDRDTYYTLETIVNQYLNSYINPYNDEEKIMYEDYYNYLTENYRKHLSRKEYIEVAEKFLNKFYININSDYEAMYTYQLLKEVYAFDNNVYLCKLESKRNNHIGYIAFQINESELAFNIVYIE